MPPKGKKTVSRGKKKKLEKILDPDERYRNALDKMHYLSKESRAEITNSCLRRILTSIKAFTLAQPPLEIESLMSREEQVNKEIATGVPMKVLPDIVRSLGLIPTDKQLRQIGWMVLNHEELQKQQRPQPKWEGVFAKFPQDNAKEVEDEYDNDVQGKLTLEDMMENPFSETVEWAAVEGKELIADREKLEAVLLDIMHTGLLVFDPANVQGGESASKFERVVTVLEYVNPEVVDNIFDVLWSTSYRQKTGDGVRFIYSSDLTRVLETVEESEKSGEPPFESDELEDLLLFVGDTGRGTISEDAFALIAL
ncbi:hypothetical protein C3747_66g115 [Trypanosoma cruzi]|uniref:Uncharacterized protein n=2 Tax=Trypanosoma cruzi TaxID=5693 RepID=Q4DF55_TRYCC|nr:hypothetical protein, conserved [Trypanosoma cruzi]EAN91156.1 hypothetical protein, conserved [Trypanosoma cruzi]PWV10773.1 hypothetical protein C3747_66g115 [Trypanosoma cruzi]RNC47450.1 hypothetical protein TcCL_NonESM02638 [Trypanosoma cruzi]|eukprot:XP_813007.1 hypothetical protein [Trypanosoma cruzi strain CL Brener]